MMSVFEINCAYEISNRTKWINKIIGERREFKLRLFDSYMILINSLLCYQNLLILIGVYSLLPFTVLKRENIILFVSLFCAVGKNVFSLFYISNLIFFSSHSVHRFIIFSWKMDCEGGIEGV